MTYVVCQTPRCQQTYPIEQFEKDDTNISCEKCGGVLIDENGRANLSQNPHVIPVISNEELQQIENRNKERVQEQLDAINKQIEELSSTVLNKDPAFTKDERDDVVDALNARISDLVYLKHRLVTYHQLVTN